MRRMAENTPAIRLTESMPGRLAGWMLAALWIFSMSGVDAHAFSSFPVCVVLAVVLVLAFAAVLAGKRLVQMSGTGWFSLAAGCFFLIRCLNSYAVVDSWCEAALILGALVYYIAGVYVAQIKSYGRVLAWLAVALALNVLAMWVTRQPWFCLEWTGRAPYTPQGCNSNPMSLFVYKNFAGFFLSLGGSALLVWSLWVLRGWKRTCSLLVGLAAVAASFFCLTRAVYLVLPLVLVVLWVSRLLIRVFHNRKLGVANIVVGCLALFFCLAAATDLLCGGRLVGVISGADSHLRYRIWASVCEVLPTVPFWGCGANATTWELIPYYNEWQLPNYAHNEYLQVWADYGVAGLLLALSLLVLHLARGLRYLAEDTVAEQRSHLVVICMLVVVAFAVYAFVDFPWHSFALVCMVAFACGVLASPFAHRRQSWFSARRWADPAHAPHVPVRAQSRVGRALILLIAAGLGAVSVWLGCRLQPAWCAQWPYNALSKPGCDVDAAARRSVISRLLPAYPSPALVDTYFMFPQNQATLEERERLLRLALAANPKQLFTVTMLVDVLGAQKKYAEAESLMREKYVGDAMPRTVLNNWPGHYAHNLLLWGRHEMQRGNHALALSLLDYALRINSVCYMSFDPIWRSGAQPWKESGGVKPGLRRLLESCETDLRLLRLTGVQPDDSWKRPMAPGGRSALYRSYVGKTGR